MTRKQQQIIIVIFLAIIYAVPVFQTIHEWKHNEGHRIQVLDLFEDIFVTPLQKAHADHKVLLTIVAKVDSLTAECNRIALQPVDTTGATSWDVTRATDMVDEAKINIKMLKKSVFDYNRHVAGEKNRHLGTDTIKPYFKSLSAVDAELVQLQKVLEGGSDAGALKSSVTKLASDVSAMNTAFGGPKGIGDLFEMTMTALQRIMIGDEYLRPYEKEIEKVSIFANGVRPWYQFTYYTLYGDLGDKGVMGRNGWYFYKPDVEYLVKHYVLDKQSFDVDANDVPIKEAIVDSIKSFKKQLADRGVDLLLVVMPGKPSIYPDMLSKNMSPEMAGKIGYSRRMMKQLNDAGIETVDLFTAFANERKNDVAAGDSIYLHTDTHFRGRAIRATAQTIADRIRQYPWYTPGTTEYEIDTVMVDRRGDIGTMTKLADNNVRELKFELPVEKTKCYQVYKVERDATGTITEKTLYADSYTSSQILVLGDSFSRIYQTDEPRSAGWISHLGYELKQPVASLVNDGGASTLVREGLARKIKLLKNKKLVVWEIVERDFRSGDKGWKDVKLVDGVQE